MKHYDYIFAGSGLSALMVCLRMVQSGKFLDKSVLLIDSNDKKTNDRTWCFWDKPGGEWDFLTSSNWKQAIFRSKDFERVLELEPYQYNLIKGIDFYNYAFDQLLKQGNFSFQNAAVNTIDEQKSLVIVHTSSGDYSCSKLFNNIFKPEILKPQNKFPILQQHFIGWHIRTNSDSFNPSLPTFMDFSIEQNGNTRFMYVLPFSKNEALVEYTLFSEKLLAENDYETAIKKYIEKLGINSYSVIGTERGSIPMTTYPFWRNNARNIINIGSAGGWTKASTGYTFKNASKKSATLVDFLTRESDFTKFEKPTRFLFYDALLLDILEKRNETGSQIFSAMFEKTKPSLILKFLDEETTFAEDLRIIARCPKRLFLTALKNWLLKKQ